MDAKTTTWQGCGDSNFSTKKLQQFSHFLNTLLEAQEYATDLQCSSWEFAVSLADARSMDVQPNDLRWMIRKGWIHHASVSSVISDRHPRLDPVHVQDPDQSQGQGQPQRPGEQISIADDSQFVLGPCGMDALGAADQVGSCDAHVSPDAAKPSASHVRPFWDPQRHELSVVGRIVKRYRWPATNQEMILMAFEEEAWPARIDDPLPRVSHLEPKRRLSDTIKCLNRNQCENLVRFRGDGTGEGILWDIRPAVGR